MTLQDLWHHYRPHYAQIGFQEAFSQLLEHHFKLPRLSIWSKPNLKLPQQQVNAFQAHMARYLDGIPLAHLLGYAPFFGLTFVVTPAVLIPRPDTERLVEAALALTPLPRHGLDIGCGSGILAITLARHLPQARFDALDSSYSALQITRVNACRLGVSPQITLHHHDLFPSADRLPASGYDLILSNPPYIDGQEMNQLDPSVRDHEPASALYGGQDGLDYYRRIISQAHLYLSPQGSLLFETGWRQAGVVAEMMRQNGYHDIQILTDFGGVERVVGGRRSDW